MRPNNWMGAALGLGTSVDALAALAAYARIHTEGIPAEPTVHALLTEIATEILGGPADDPGSIGPSVIGFAQTWLSQADELVKNPGRQGGWEQVDVPLLQSIGRGSMSIAGAIRAAEDALGSLGATLAAPGATFLDVGTGTAWLAIAMARSHPGLRVVGIDIFEPALDLARANIASVSMGDRVELRRDDVTTLPATAEYDAIWLPMPFLPADIVPRAMAAAFGALRPGGWVLAGTFAGTDDRLSRLLTDLRTVRCGGYPWQSDELVNEIAAAGFLETAHVLRSWSAPVQLHVGRRPVAPFQAAREPATST